MAQWLSICLPMQGTWAQSLIPSAGCAPRPRRRTMTCSTACERDDVLLVAVGSCVRCRLPLVRSCTSRPTTLETQTRRKVRLKEIKWLDHLPLRRVVGTQDTSEVLPGRALLSGGWSRDRSGPTSPGQDHRALFIQLCALELTSDLSVASWAGPPPGREHTGSSPRRGHRERRSRASGNQGGPSPRDSCTCVS